MWFDTAGVVKVEGHSPAPQTLVEYPAGDDFIGVNPDDPPGIHLLALVAGRMSPGEALPLLEQRLADVGKPPTTLPRRWSEQVRGAGRKFGEPVVLPSRYLRGIAERLPPGLELVHAIFLRTEK